jgi:transcriptional regulator with XRE-family HTH domain
MNIAVTIKARRIKLNLSVKDVASKLGVAESTYRDWENGRKIQGEPYLELSKILNLPLGELFGVETAQP